MYWQVQRGDRAAVVTVSGASELVSAQNLERTCARLLMAGKRVDLDARNLAYADCHLLAALYRLSCVSLAHAEGAEEQASRFRVAAGSVLHRALAREHLLGKLVTIEAPDVPQDAVEDPPEWEGVSEERSPATETRALFAQGA